jgi:RNA polymerase sigma-70 factor, ECF subfamily
MQELALNPVGRTLERTAVDTEESRTRREFETLLAEIGPLSFRVTRGVLRNDADAEEVAQEALFRAYQRFSDLRNPARFRAWIVRITFRLALDRRRSSRRREVRETAWSLPERRPAPPTAEDVAVSSEFQDRLENALEELPDKLRIVVLLSAIQGYTLEEVSEMLEVPLGTVKSRLFHARKHWRRSCDELSRGSKEHQRSARQGEVGRCGRARAQGIMHGL